MYYLLAFVCGFFLGAMVIALCAAARNGDRMAERMK
jgi:hypothetical protein